MQMSYEQLRDHSLALSVEERRQLADSLLASLDEEESNWGERWESAELGYETTDQHELSTEWKAEIARRVEEIKSGRAVTYSLAEIEAALSAVVDR